MLRSRELEEVAILWYFDWRGKQGMEDGCDFGPPLETNKDCWIVLECIPHIQYMFDRGYKPWILVSNG